MRVLICEDSRSFALGLTRFLEHDGDIRVIGVCATGEELLDSVGRLNPDVVTMDLELPGLDGARATERVMRRHPCPILVISSHAQRGSERAAAALSSGALEAIPKSEIRLDRVDGATATGLRRRIRRLAAARVVPRTAERSAANSLARHATAGGAVAAGPRWPAAHRTAVIGIAASTGGPRALNTVLEGLPTAFPLPVLVVQHMAPGFVEGLARWLDGLIAIPVGMARDGQLAGPGVWFAPDGAHLVVDSQLRLSLDSSGAAGPHRPSADALLLSMAAAFGEGAAAAVLTGMGRDGAQGAGAIVDAGGLVVAEHESTAAVNGMPAAAAAQGAQSVVPIDQVAELLTRLRPIT